MHMLSFSSLQKAVNSGPNKSPRCCLGPTNITVQGNVPPPLSVTVLLSSAVLHGPAFAAPASLSFLPVCLSLPPSLRRAGQQMGWAPPDPHTCVVATALSGGPTPHSTVVIVQDGKGETVPRKKTRSMHEKPDLTWPDLPTPINNKWIYILDKKKGKK